MVVVVVVVGVEEGEGGEKVRVQSNHMVANSLQSFPQRLLKLNSLSGKAKDFNVLFSTDSQT